MQLGLEFLKLAYAVGECILIHLHPYFKLVKHAFFIQYDDVVGCGSLNFGQNMFDLGREYVDPVYNKHVVTAALDGFHCNKCAAALTGFHVEPCDVLCAVTDNGQGLLGNSGKYQLSLLALGLNPGRNPGVPKAPTDKRGPGDMVQIRVSWNAGSEKREVRAEDMIYNRPARRVMRKTGWVFMGSQVWEGAFAADETGSLITTYHDVLAVLECPLKTVADDTLYFANDRVVPPVGTKVTVTITIPTAERKD